MKRRGKPQLLTSGDPKLLVMKFNLTVPLKKKMKYLKGVHTEFKFAKQSQMPDIHKSESKTSDSGEDESEFDEGVIVEHLVASVWMGPQITADLSADDRLKQWRAHRRNAQTCNLCMDGFTKVDNKHLFDTLWEVVEAKLFGDKMKASTKPMASVTSTDKLKHDGDSDSEEMYGPGIGGAIDYGHLGDSGTGVVSQSAAQPIEIEEFKVREPMSGAEFKYSAIVDLHKCFWVAVRVSCISRPLELDSSAVDESGRYAMGGYGMDDYAKAAFGDEDYFDLEEDDDLLSAERTCVLSDVSALFEMKCEESAGIGRLFADPMPSFEDRVGTRFFPIWSSILQEYLYADDVTETEATEDATDAVESDADEDEGGDEHVEEEERDEEESDSW